MGTWPWGTEMPTRPESAVCMAAGQKPRRGRGLSLAGLPKLAKTIAVYFAHERTERHAPDLLQPIPAKTEPLQLTNQWIAQGAALAVMATLSPATSRHRSAFPLKLAQNLTKNFRLHHFTLWHRSYLGRETDFNKSREVCAMLRCNSVWGTCRAKSVRDARRFKNS